MGYQLSRAAFLLICGVFIAALILSSCVVIGYFLAQNYRQVVLLSVFKNVIIVPSVSDKRVPCKKAMETAEPWVRNHRVPEAIKPEHYSILLHPLLQEGTFSGTVEVTLRITNEISYIPIHIKNLNITKTRLFRTDTGEIDFAAAFHSPENMFWVILMPKNASLPLGEVRLYLEFNGLLTGKIVGFYRSTYNNRLIATSKFEPTDARAAFPCFDEPSLKATYSIRLVRPNIDNYIALSNTVAESFNQGPGALEVTVQFAKTVPMSTYLVCFIVCDFKYLNEVFIPNNGDNKVPIKVYATEDQIENTKFALSCALQVTQYYIDYFKIAYPLPKLDLIAIPDFISGAMEHWGLITFRETALLFDEKKNSASERQRVAAVVAHELAHQWFGNLVTMQWWDDLWLNEGFASFMEAKAIDASIAEAAKWNMGSQNLISKLHPVLIKDSALNSHPIVQPVENPDQINQMFDFISYNKGSMVLRMLESFMGPEKFQTGLQNYLNKFKMGSAATKDLWACLDEVVDHQNGVKVSNVMATWTLQMGFPLVSVTRQQNRLILKQSRFLADVSLHFNSSESPFGYKWDIPIKYITSQDKTEKLVWLLKDADELTLPVDSVMNFVKLNSRQVGFYRVNYDVQDWEKFIQLLNDKNTTDLNALLSETDRAHLLDDAFNLAAAGYINYKLAFNLLNYIAKDRDYLPWATAKTLLGSIKSKLAKRPVFSKFQNYVKSLVESLYGTGEISWDDQPNEDHLYKLLRVRILSLACDYGLQSCLTDVGEKFLSWLNDHQTPLSPDLRSLIYFYGMHAVGSTAEWDRVWSMYKNSTNAQEKINFLRALANVKDPVLLKRFLEYAKDEGNIRSQDYFIVLGYIAENPLGVDIMWDFYRNEWDYLVKRFTLGHRIFGSFILTVTESFCSKLRLDELNAFIERHPDAGAGEASRRNALENIQTRIKWLERKESEISDWLTANNFV